MQGAGPKRNAKVALVREESTGEPKYFSVDGGGEDMCKKRSQVPVSNTV